MPAVPCLHRLQGDYVILAAEPVCICGCDVVAPLRTRRRAGEPLAAFLARFDRQFTPAERQRIGGAGADAEQETEFRCASGCCSLGASAVKAVLCAPALPAWPWQGSCHQDRAAVPSPLMRLFGCVRPAATLQQAVGPERGVCEGHGGGPGL